MAKIDNNIFRIRLKGIDCFKGTKNKRAKLQSEKYNLPIDEIIQGGNIAGKILSQKLQNKEAFFEFQGIDKYNRALGIIYLDGLNINNEMLKTKYCKPYN